MIPVADRGCVRFAGSFKKVAKGIDVVAVVTHAKMRILSVFVVCFFDAD